MSELPTLAKGAVWGLVILVSVPVLWFLSALTWRLLEFRALHTSEVLGSRRSALSEPTALPAPRTQPWCAPSTNIGEVDFVVSYVDGTDADWWSERNAHRRFRERASTSTSAVAQSAERLETSPRVPRRSLSGASSESDSSEGCGSESGSLARERGRRRGRGRGRGHDADECGGSSSGEGGGEVSDVGGEVNGGGEVNDEGGRAGFVDEDDARVPLRTLFSEGFYTALSIHRFAPWYRTIIFLTPHRAEPPFFPALRERGVRLRHVCDRDIVDRHTPLPFFNSLPAEANLHRIPGLSEKFVYANDDMLLSAPCPAGFFFHDPSPLGANTGAAARNPGETAGRTLGPAGQSPGAQGGPPAGTRGNPPSELMRPGAAAAGARARAAPRAMEEPTGLQGARGSVDAGKPIYRPDPSYFGPEMALGLIHALPEWCLPRHRQLFEFQRLVNATYREVSRAHCDGKSHFFPTSDHCPQALTRSLMARSEAVSSEVLNAHTKREMFRGDDPHSVTPVMLACGHAIAEGAMVYREDTGCRTWYSNFCTAQSVKRALSNNHMVCVNGFKTPDEAKRVLQELHAYLIE